MKRTRLHSFAPPAILEWTNSYHRSRGRPRSHLGTQALFCYFISYLWSNSWCSGEEMLSGPDYKDTQNRSKYKIDAYMPHTYCLWLDTVSKDPDGKIKTAVDFLDDRSPDHIQELKDRFGDRLYMTRSRSLHLKRAIIIYYKLSMVNPGILELDLDLIRPDGYTWQMHNFQDNNYLLEYSAKVAKLINVDLSCPPNIQLTTY